jgi:hypothetical protein
MDFENEQILSELFNKSEINKKNGAKSRSRVIV